MRSDIILHLKKEITSDCSVRNDMESPDLVCIVLSYQIAILNDMQISMPTYDKFSQYHQTTLSEMCSLLNEYRVISNVPFSPYQNMPGVAL
ncbi:hypothetical protein TNCV_3663401 [Trichonephila clavipes]|nr:hypothetical protein TNCV_3663401 [Trichonephila clavipes]